MTKIIPL